MTMTAPGMLQMSISRDGTTTYEAPELFHTEKTGGIFYTIFPRGYRSEFKELLRLAIPVIITQATQCMIGPVALMFCGRLGTTEFDAATLSTTLLNALGISIVLGLSTACDTLFSQIYGSVSSRRKLGVVLTRSLIFIPLCILAPIAILLNAEVLLIGMGQNAEVAKQAGRYLTIFIPGLLGYSCYMPMTKYLQSQNIVVAPMIIGLISNGVNIGLHFLLMTYLNYGIIGSAISVAMAYITMPIFTIIYISASKVYRDTWTGWSTECLLDWFQFLCLSWFGLVMICIEWWAYEIGLIIAGVLGTTELAALSVTFTVATYGFIVVMGLSIAANIRIGHFLGACDPVGAKNCYRVVLSVTWGVSTTFACLYCGLNDYVPYMVTNIPEVVESASNLLPWYSLIALFEGTFVVCGGILRGSGRQKLASGVVFISYIIGLSVALPIMIKTGQVVEFWRGLLAGVITESVVLVTICILTDWDVQAEKALERVMIATQQKLAEIDKCLNEEYPLLQKNNNTDDYQPIGDDNHDNRVTLMVYIRTLVVVLTMVVILITGILCRVYIPVYVYIPPMLHPNVTYVNESLYEPWIQ